MKRSFIPILFLTILTKAQSYGYVGINTTSPKVTLDVVGSPTDTNKFDGIIPPRITGDQLAAKIYTSEQTGAMVYVTASATNLTGQVIYVSEADYYLFDGSVWKPIHDPLYDVVNRGNYSPRYISFTGNSITKQGNTDSALGMNSDTYSMYFGNMNQSHTGAYNISLGYNTLSSLTTGFNNVAIGHYNQRLLTTGNSNSTFGVYAGEKLTTGKYNTFIGFSSGQGANSGNVNVGIGNSSLMGLTSGYKNLGIGQSALQGLTTGAYNVALGQSSGLFLTNENKNVFIGAQTGAYVKGSNNVFIGTGAGHSNSVTTIETINNRLVIHSNANLVPNTEISSENTVDLSASYTNGLIIGDFAQRWLKINGRFILNPSYHTSDNSFSKQVIAKADGTLGLEDRVAIPIPPSTRTYILKSVDGILQWGTP